MKPHKNKEYKISPNGKGVFASYSLESIDGTHLVDMEFSNNELAERFAKKHGFVLHNFKNDMNTTQLKSPSKIINSLSNDQLRSLLKEIKNIGNSDTPKEYKKSPNMELLFKTYNLEYKWAVFYDTHSNITNLINYEILNRIVIDKF